MKSPIGYWFLWILVLLLLGSNIWLFLKFLNVQSGLSNGASDIVETLDQARTESISYTAHINQSVPVSGTFDINETVTIPVKANVPIKTTVVVPVVIPLTGEVVNVSVPINTTVPVDTAVSLPIKKIITLKGSSPVSVDIPVEIPIASTPFAEILNKLKERISKNAGI